MEKNGQGKWILRLKDGAIGEFTGEVREDDFFNGIIYITTPNGKISTTEFKDGVAGKTIITN